MITSDRLAFMFHLRIRLDPCVLVLCDCGPDGGRDDRFLEGSAPAIAAAIAKVAAIVTTGIQPDRYYLPIVGTDKHGIRRVLEIAQSGFVSQLEQFSVSSDDTDRSGLSLGSSFFSTSRKVA